MYTYARQACQDACSRFGWMQEGRVATKSIHLGEQCFRLWIATCENWLPARWNEVSPLTTALEPYDDQVYALDDAAHIVAGFNESVLEQLRAHGNARAGSPTRWLLARPVMLRAEGDVVNGQPVQGFSFTAKAHRAIDS